MLAGRTHLSVEVLEQLAGQVVAIGAAVVVGSVPEGTDPMATRRENELSSFCKKVIFVFVLLPSPSRLLLPSPSRLHSYLRSALPP